MTGRIYGSRQSDIQPTLIGAPRPRVGSGSPPIVDLRQYCTYVDDQVGSRCVGDAFKGANWVVGRATGRHVDSRGVYVLARSRERARRTDTISDSGCMPADAYDAVVAVGVYPADALEMDAAAIDTMITWDEELAAVKIPASAFEPLDDGNTDALDAGLAMGHPSTYTQAVDTSYEELRSSSPVWAGPQTPTLGYHRQVVVGRILVTGVPCYISWNSWGKNWSEGGFAYIPCDVFARIASEIVVHHAGVVL